MTVRHDPKRNAWYYVIDLPRGEDGKRKQKHVRGFKTDKLAQRSPTALALAKRSFNADSDNIRGISNLALHAVKMFYDTAESKEGVAAFNEKRTPDFHKFTS